MWLSNAVVRKWVIMVVLALVLFCLSTMFLFGTWRGPYEVFRLQSRAEEEDGFRKLSSLITQYLHTGNDREN